jgi:hypothetical protein
VTVNPVSTEAAGPPAGVVKSAVERGDDGQGWTVEATACVVEVDCAVTTGSVVVGTDVVGPTDDGTLEVDDDFPPLLPHAARSTTAETTNDP